CCDPCSLLYILSLRDALPISGAAHANLQAVDSIWSDLATVLTPRVGTGVKIGVQCGGDETAEPQYFGDQMMWGCEIGLRSWFSRSEEHTSELQSRENLVCRLL